jgi:hypothetical protein
MSNYSSIIKNSKGWRQQSDLFPFAAEYISKAQESFMVQNKLDKHPSLDNSEFVRFLFVNYESNLTKSNNPENSTQLDKLDKADETVPTINFPWGTEQLKKVGGDLEKGRNYLVDKYKRDPAFIDVVQQVDPFYNLWEIDQAIDNLDFIIASGKKHTNFLPVRDVKLLHFLRIFYPEDQRLKNVSFEKADKMSLEDRIYVRRTLLQKWAGNPSLRNYVKNCVAIPTTDLIFPNLIPFHELLSSYLSWDDKPRNRVKEISPQMGKYMWSIFVLIRTKTLLKLDGDSVTYRNLMTLLSDNMKDYEVTNTPTGILLLDKKEQIRLLSLRNMDHSPYKSPGGLDWNKTSLKSTINQLLKMGGSDNEFSTSMRKFEVKLSRVSYFLHALYRTDRDFRLHTVGYLGTIESLRQVYLKTTNKGKDMKLPVKKSELRKMIVGKMGENTSLEKAATKVFEEDVAARPRRVVPILSNSKRYADYVNREYSMYRMADVTDSPQKSDCEDRPSERHFLTATNVQNFTADEFEPSCPFHGKLRDHSVGQGKTCIALKSGSRYKGYRILWVTKTSLKTDVFKNHVNEICNEIVKLEYDKKMWMEGEDAALLWLKTVPALSSPDTITSRLRQLGMNWTNMSYRQFSNALTQQNAYGREWLEDAVLASTGSEVDVLRKTLVIFDEAPNMYNYRKLGRNELPDLDIVKKAFQQSYRISGYERVRVLMLTATPLEESFLPFFSMMNMLHTEDTFPAMRHIDPAVPSDMFVDHVKEVIAANSQLELNSACTLFPGGTTLCPDTEKKGEKEESLDEENEGRNFFDARGLTGVSSFTQRDLQNNLQDFWNKTAGLITFLDVSNDYSLFSRTEFKTVITPSLTRFQEVLILSALSSGELTPMQMSKKIKHIVSWARFQRVKGVGKDKEENSSQSPSTMDLDIIKENKNNLFMEPTYQNTVDRKNILESQIAIEEVKDPPENHQESINNLEKQISSHKSKLKLLEEDWDKNIIEKAKNKSRAGSKNISKTISNLKGKVTKQRNDILRLTNMTRDLQEYIDSFNQIRKAKIASLKRDLEKTERSLKNFDKNPDLKFKNKPSDLVKFLNQSVEEYAVEDEGSKKKGRKNTMYIEDEGDDDVIVELSSDDDDDDLEKGDSEEAENFKGSTYEEKSWTSRPQKVVGLPHDKYPSKHRFDQPDTFSSTDFRKDMSLYGPKTEKLLEVIRDNDKTDKSAYGNVRKRMIFCEDIHAIRAVAGSLMANGWKFGMRKETLKWEKRQYNSDTGEEIKGRRRKSPAKTGLLSWMPHRDTSPKNDYNRFLILSRSKIGGLSGATVSDFAVKKITGKGGEGTFNRDDNVFGKNWRIVIIDKNFMEGVDLPATYADIFDPVLSRAHQTQIVGRINRFCGMRNMPFTKGFGWPQYVYRYSSKFHTVGIDMTPEREELIKNNFKRFPDVVPDNMLDSFIEKLKSNVFSPTELRLILDGNMESQKLRKRTMDAYSAMIARSNVGYKLFKGGMLNYQKAQTELTNKYIEEEQTVSEYKQNVFTVDTSRRELIQYNLRNLRKDLMEKYDISEVRVISMVRSFVLGAIRRTKKSDMSKKWKEESTARDNLFRKISTAVSNDARFVDVPDETLRKLMSDLIEEMTEGKIEDYEDKQIKKLAKSARKTSRIQNAARVFEKKRTAELIRKIRTLKNDMKVSNKYLRDNTDSMEILIDKVSVSLPDRDRNEIVSEVNSHIREKDRKPASRSRQKPGSRSMSKKSNSKRRNLKSRQNPVQYNVSTDDQYVIDEKLYWIGPRVKTRGSNNVVRMRDLRRDLSNLSVSELVYLSQYFRIPYSGKRKLELVTILTPLIIFE